MTQVVDNDTLSDRHYATLILRLTLDQGGNLIQGDLVDTSNARPEHFFGEAGLQQALDTWLRQQNFKAEQDL